MLTWLHPTKAQIYTHFIYLFDLNAAFFKKKRSNVTYTAILQFILTFHHRQTDWTDRITNANSPHDFAHLRGQISTRSLSTV